MNQSLYKCRPRFYRTSWQKCIFRLFKTVLWVRRLVANQSAWRYRFDPRLVRVGFVLDKAAFGQVSPRVLQFSPVTVIAPVLLTVILSMCHRKYVMALTLFVSVSLLEKKCCRNLACQQSVGLHDCVCVFLRHSLVVHCSSLVKLIERERKKIHI
jgi:hypothetical protein